MGWGWGLLDNLSYTMSHANSFTCVQVATSDGVLRAYTFGNSSAPASIVAPPRPLPLPPAGLAACAGSAAGAAAAAPGGMEAKAAAVALPSDEEEEWEEQVGET